MGKISKWIKTTTQSLRRDDIDHAVGDYAISPDGSTAGTGSTTKLSNLNVEDKYKGIGSGYQSDMETGIALQQQQQPQQQQQQQSESNIPSSPAKSTSSNNNSAKVNLSPSSKSNKNISNNVGNEAASGDLVSNATSRSEADMTGSGSVSSDGAKRLVISHPRKTGSSAKMGNDRGASKSNNNNNSNNSSSNKNKDSQGNSNTLHPTLSDSTGSGSQNENNAGSRSRATDTSMSGTDEEYGLQNHHQIVNSHYHGHLNSLFNGHLMKWKFESEEGTAFVRIPAFFAGLSLIATSVTALVLYPESWTISSFVITAFVFVISFTICILDGRFLSSSPLSWRAHLRNVITRHFNIFRFLWGRALLYLAAGLLSCALFETITIVSGAVMLFVGFLALMVGTYTSRKFSSLRNSLADESFLLLEFSTYDYDDDGYLSATEFSHLLNALGMELDDRYSLKAFNAIDVDHDRKISFEEFSRWWSQGYIERGRKGMNFAGGPSDDSNASSGPYSRLD